ncbi:MAG: DUF370 domain-containing protein [Clostridia bacterium]|nr:DUF370 domain-containing protein [Clostridia bacterium]MBR5881624.1 DUF370 domain-containing protein [Clostridia bacterium]
MFLHVGNNKNIREKDIIGIFDTDNATLSPITKKYLARAEKNGLVVSARNEIPKSFVLYRSKDGYNICFSQLSATALSGRMKDPSSL